MRRAPDRDGAIEFGFVVDLHQDGEAGGGGEVVEAAEAIVVEDGDDQEDGVGARIDGFEDLAFVDDEVFAQQRELRPPSRMAFRIGQRALEELSRRSGPRGNRRRRLVILGDADGVEVRDG
jgi:hypothetical protein